MEKLLLTPALIKEKPLDKYEWWADEATCKEFYDELKVFLARNIAKQLSIGVEEVEAAFEYSGSLLKIKSKTTSPLSKSSEEKLQDKLNNLIKQIKSKLIIIKGVHFPAARKKAKWDYQELFSIIENVKFVDCHFYGTHVFSENFDLAIDVNPFYKSCVFKNKWLVVRIRQADFNIPFFDSCEFKFRVLIKGNVCDYFSTVGYTCLFKECNINDIDIKNILVDSELFYFSKNNHASLSSLRITDCVFNKRFSLNNANISNKLILHSTVFEEKFELTSCKINKAIFNNTNFNRLADFYESEFRSFRLIKAIFKDFASFEKCIFGKNNDKVEKITLNYVTFYSFINFRHSVFNQPLDLGNTNQQQQPNFLNANFTKQAAVGTNRETFRIIKHSFDSVGNHVEASKYFAYEMQAYRRELSEDEKVKNYRERVLLGFNAFISGHGENWVKAASLFFIMLAIIGSVLTNDKYQWIPTHQAGWGWWNSLLGAANTIALGFLPLTTLYQGREHLAAFLLVATLLLSGITWHLLVAVRRHSKR